jgi:hypothetical protein
VQEHVPVGAGAKADTAGAAEPAWYPGLKTALFALLACNTAYYVVSGTMSEALDAGAWLALLALFQLETGFGRRLGGAATVIRIARLGAAVAVGAAAVGYVNQREWLDATNIALWIAVVVLLELELRRPAAVARRRAGFAATAAAVYGGLAVLVLIWAWRGEWFDAYDAMLWLAAFVMIEMDVLQIYRLRAAA